MFEEMSLKCVQDIAFKAALAGGDRTFNRWHLVGDFGVMGGSCPQRDLWGLVQPTFLFKILTHGAKAGVLSPIHCHWVCCVA